MKKFFVIALVLVPSLAFGQVYHYGITRDILADSIKANPLLKVDSSSSGIVDPRITITLSPIYLFGVSGTESITFVSSSNKSTSVVWQGKGFNEDDFEALVKPHAGDADFYRDDHSVFDSKMAMWTKGDALLSVTLNPLGKGSGIMLSEQASKR